MNMFIVEVLASVDDGLLAKFAFEEFTEFEQSRLQDRIGYPIGGLDIDHRQEVLLAGLYASHKIVELSLG